MQILVYEKCVNLLLFFHFLETSTISPQDRVQRIKDDIEFLQTYNFSGGNMASVISDYGIVVPSFVTWKSWQPITYSWLGVRRIQYPAG